MPSCLNHWFYAWVERIISPRTVYHKQGLVKLQVVGTKYFFVRTPSHTYINILIINKQIILNQ